MTDAGLTLTQQAPAAAATTVDADQSPSNLWGTLASTEDFQQALVAAVLDGASGHSIDSLLDALEDADIDALHGAYQSLIVRTAAGDSRAMWDLLAATRRLGTGRSPIDDVAAPARVLGLADHTPTIAVRVTHEFRERRADQRRAVCRVIAELARGCDVRVVATGFMQHWLAREHRADLPGGVSDQAATHPPHGPHSGEDLVAHAHAELDPDGRETRILRLLADESSETRTYHSLYTAFSVTKSRTRQCITRLVDLGLAASFDAPDGRGRAIELLPSGREYLDQLDQEIGRQQSLSDAVSDPGQSSDHSRVDHDESRSPPTKEASTGRHGRQEGLVDVTYLSRWHHAAAVGCAPSSGVVLVDHPIPPADDGREPGWSYDADADKLVVSAEFHNPLQYWVCIARALTDWRTFRHVLTADRLDGDDGDLGGLAVDDLDVLRNARCLGYLKDADATGEGYITALKDANTHLLELTWKLNHGEYDDRRKFRSTIAREALGLASSMIHLLDLAGVDVVREVRLPEFTRNFDGKRRGELVSSLAKAVAIQSRYNEYAAYRQLYESREDRRAAAMDAAVDASDPEGEMIGSVVLVGPGVDDLEADLVESLESPAPLHEAAPEFAIRVDVRRPSRAAYAETVRWMCRAKNVDATREAVSVLEAFTGSPYDVARALRALGSEELRREIRLDEVRFALGTLSADRLFPGGAPSMGKLVRVLLSAETPLSRSTLAERAGVSTRTVRRHAGRLEAFDFIVETDGMFQVALPVSRDEERNGDRLPWYVVANRDREDYRDATVKGVLAEVYDRYDFDGCEAVADAMGEFTKIRIPSDIREDVREAWPWAGPVLEAVEAMAANEPSVDPVETVRFGADIEQTSLGSAVTPRVADAD